jgi:hypothetical protein
MKLLEIISVDFNETDQLLIRFSAFVIYWRTNGSTMRQYINFKKAYDSVRRKVLYSILIAFDIPTKLVRQIKIPFNETYGKFHMGQKFSDMFSIQI